MKVRYNGRLNGPLSQVVNSHVGSREEMRFEVGMRKKVTDSSRQDRVDVVVFLDCPVNPDVICHKILLEFRQRKSS